MAASYFKQGIHNKRSAFDLFFRKNPFKGTFAVFAGIDEVLEFLQDFKITPEEIEFLKSLLPHLQPEFFAYLSDLNMDPVKVYSLDSGTVCFGHQPLIRVEGPLGHCQLIETALLNLVNYPTLITTNASRFKLKVREPSKLIEMGLRRAQGPNGALTGSKYCYVGGFTSTSNTAAAMKYGIPCQGTHSHSYVMSFSSLNDVESFAKEFRSLEGEQIDLLSEINDLINVLPKCFSETNKGELAAFVAYAVTFPSGFLALVDTYNTVWSGVLNFILVATILLKYGYTPIGIRLDSGNLADLSFSAKNLIDKYLPDYSHQVNIVASNDISEASLTKLANTEHYINCFGIGTMLITCHAQPALGCVYKLVELDGIPRIKLSNEISKSSLPGQKKFFRLFIESSPYAVADYICLQSEEDPQPGQTILVRSLTPNTPSVGVVPIRVEPLLNLCWEGKVVRSTSVAESRQRVSETLSQFDPALLNATQCEKKYLVGISSNLYRLLHELQEKELYVETLE
ncbi:hypothetical protein GEMRC1_006230 [Eukaryota sp. GEM-RC1]